MYVSGHAPGLAGAKAQYQHHGVWLAGNGFVAFVLDTIEFGEIPGIHHGVHDLAMWHWLSLGYTPAAVEVWNAIRALDYLETRPEVDATRAGITGRSGGGAVSWFTAAADDRFKVSAPVHGTWSVGPHVAGDTVRENCDCIYFWNTYQFDLPLAGALIAPRPLMIVNASKDGAFPPAGYEPVEQCLRPVYGWYGALEKLAAFSQETGHQDTPAYRKAADEWLNRWLRNDRTPYDEGVIERETDARLTVLDRYPADALNEGIDRTFIPAYKLQNYKSLPAWNQRRRGVGRGPQREGLPRVPEKPGTVRRMERQVGGWTQKYADSFNVEFTTEESVRVQGQLFIPRNGKTSHPALIYVKDKDDIVFSVDYDLLLSAFADHVVLVLNPRAVDYPMNVNRTSSTKMTAALLGGTLESMQLWDILRSVDYLIDEQKLSLSAISVYGRKQMGGLAIHAAAQDSRISRVILDDPPSLPLAGTCVAQHPSHYRPARSGRHDCAARDCLYHANAGSLSLHPINLQSVWQTRFDSSGGLARRGLAGMGTLTVMTICKRAVLLFPVAAVLLSAQPRSSQRSTSHRSHNATNSSRRTWLSAALRSLVTSFKALTTSKTGSGGVRKFVANFSTCWGWTLCLHAPL